MEAPSTLLCDLRPYQKQALNWMIQLERGHCMDEAAATMHPCWDGYRLVDKYARLQWHDLIFYNQHLDLINFYLLVCRRGLVIYLNAFSGDATTEFPSTLQMARGGVC